jgi:hypothetical protein
MMVYYLLCMCTGLYVAAWEKKRELEEEVSLLQTGMHMHQFIYYKLLHTRGVWRRLATHRPIALKTMQFSSLCHNKQQSTDISKGPNQPKISNR